MQPQNQNRVQVYSSGLHGRMRRDDTDNSSLAHVTTGVDLQWHQRLITDPDVRTDKGDDQTIPPHLPGRFVNRRHTDAELNQTASSDFGSGPKQTLPTSELTSKLQISCYARTRRRGITPRTLILRRDRIKHTITPPEREIGKAESLFFRELRELECDAIGGGTTARPFYTDMS
ncbi:hypothetical protein FOXYSP1_04778 [Fusarium oxysporum f. sp. phaseoli]